jgi:hypothetical protein
MMMCCKNAVRSNGVLFAGFFLYQHVADMMLGNAVSLHLVRFVLFWRSCQCAARSCTYMQMIVDVCCAACMTTPLLLLHQYVKSIYCVVRATTNLPTYCHDRYFPSFYTYIQNTYW